jgi:large subunit ribosomal protein L7Ae
MVLKDKKPKSNKGKTVPKAPIQVASAPASTTVKKSPLFEKRARNYRIGGDIQPKRNLTRFTKWPQYIRLQRQKRILLQRLKVPPSIAQFQHTVDKTQMAALTRLCKKIAPETKAQKAQRIKEMGAKKDKTDNRSLPVLKFGINHVTDLVEQKKAKLVLIAHDVDPIELVVWLPTLCRKKNVAYCIVKGKSRLGQLVGKKSATCVAITTTKKEDSKDLEVLCESMKAAFNDNKDIQRKWGGGIMGVKSNHITVARQKALERELAKKTGVAM